MQNIILSQQFMVTAAVFLAALLSFAGLTFKERRPRDTFKTPMLPTIPLMMVTAIVGLLALVHLVNLLGVHTGR
jgi:multisubunit Na+/H+ antiporter MnhB subunit